MIYSTGSLYTLSQQLSIKAHESESMSLRWRFTQSLPKKVFIWRGNPRCEKVALTFDDGPHEGTTREVLDILRKHKVKATFFLSGVQVVKNPHLPPKILNDGHEIGNHSYNHVELYEMKFKEIVEEISKTQEAIKKCTGFVPKLFRAPYGAVNFKIILGALKCRLTTVRWTVDLHDYLLKEPAEILERMNRSHIKGGEIIYLHDGLRSTLQALPDLIEVLNDRGMKTGLIKEVI
jgi:peptidoglycan/xylan/chitin deacetylase (PgdA/CDA1 family)